MSRRSRTRREVLGKHFSRFQAANPGRLHFAAHSHHPWPDATEDAHARYWSDSAALADRKWEKKVFGEGFIEAARREPWDLVWLSHVFFDSAFIVEEVEAICDAAPAQAMVVLDGYHAFCALPVDLSRIHRRAFYLAGGYKYAMAGEG